MTDLSTIARWSAIPLENHLWQSTAFGLAAACLTLLLKRNAARIRFSIWLLASIKFLLPFALLTHALASLGAHAIHPARGGFVSIVEVVNQPFAQFVPNANSPSTSTTPLLNQLPLCLAALWIAGTLVVVVMWSLRWLQVFRTKRRASLLRHAVETDLLQALTSRVGVKTLPLLTTNSNVEPGVFGIFNPVLLWPINMSDKLTEPQLNAILAHEVWHVRRRDNLAAALQMFIEAIFWFHPLVWWLGARQMEERERACDEGVLGLGSLPAVYAEGILKTCKFCVEAPLPCVAGVNGSNLKKRITRIMNQTSVVALSKAKKLILGSSIVLVAALPVVLGTPASSVALAQVSSTAAAYRPLQITKLQKNTSGTSMSRTTFTPEGTSIINTTVRSLIEMAYSLKSYQLTGGPGWIDQDRYDISYTGGEPVGMRVPMSNAAVQEILSERFHLVLRQETKNGPVLALVVDDGGVKFPSVTPQKAPGTDEPLLSMSVQENGGQGQIALTGGPGGLADTLSSQINQPILDKTGLTGTYDINFHWSTASASPDSLSSDLQQQLGLHLIPQEGPVQTSVIESITNPSGS